ncbi:MAG TPA: hypothetical protein VMG08_01600 [Allosphingosinicella sp.]|nr:hypothetical protein [Allosphingosinicella sp.]
MATEKLYLASDALSGTATVVEVIDLGDRQRVRLDQTLFHPQGGGQKADRGTIGEFEVADVRHTEDGEVDHVVLGSSFSAGQRVALAVDQAWRDEARRWHSAGHLLADCVVALNGQLRPLRGHHWPQEGRVEFQGDAIGLGALSERLPQMLAAAIEEDIPFRIVGDPNRSRALQIADHQPVPCGGTHVASARALLGLQVRKVQQKEGMLRISYTFSDN